MKTLIAIVTIAALFTTSPAIAQAHYSLPPSELPSVKVQDEEGPDDQDGTVETASVEVFDFYPGEPVESYIDCNPGADELQPAWITESTESLAIKNPVPDYDWFEREPYFTRRDSTIHFADLIEPSDEGGEYVLLVTAGRFSGSCTRYGGFDVEYDEHGETVVSVYHYLVSRNRIGCTRDYIMDTLAIPLGTQFEAGRRHTVTVNDTDSIAIMGISR